MNRMLFVLLLVAACESVVDIDPPTYEAELVATSYFTPDSIWTAQVSQTIPIGQETAVGAPFIKNARVTVWHDDQLIDRLLYAGSYGKYVSENRLRPRANTEYTLKVESPAFTAMEAHSAVPALPRITQANVRLDPKSNREFPRLMLRFRLEDDDAHDNYYSFSTYLISSTNVLNNQIAVSMKRTDAPVWHCTFDDALNPLQEQLDPNSDRDEWCLLGIMTDRLFDGKAQDLEYSLSQFHVGDGLDQHKIMLAFISMSEDYFKYQRSLELMQNDSDDPFSEPFPLHTNFDNGRGIFAGYSLTSTTIDLQ